MIKKILFISLPLIVLSACLFFSISAYMQYRDHYVSVYVASHNIAQRTCLGEEDLYEMKVPKEYLSDDVYTDKQDILGKYVKLSYALAKGSLFYKGALQSDIKDLAYTLLKQGEVNYDLYTSEIKINSGVLSVGMYLDLYLTMGNLDKAYSDLLIEGCRITGLYDNQGKVIRDFDTDYRTAIVSVAIDKKDVAVLNKAMMLGNISAVAGSNVYDDSRKAKLNEDSFLMEYLQ